MFTSGTRKIYGNFCSVKSSLAFIFGVSICLYDLYYPPLGRVFDYFALLLISVIVFNQRSFISPIAIMAVVLFLMLYGILGFIDYQSLLGLCFGLVIFFLTFKVIPEIKIKLYYSMGSAVVLAFLLQIVQLVYFDFFGGVLDITGALGSIESRIYIERIHFFRPSGFFQEPNSLCVLFVLVFLAFYYSNQQINSHFDLLVMSAALAGLALSNSLWGWAWFVLLFCFYARKVNFRWVVIVITALVITSPYWLQEFSFERIVNIHTESSVRERFVGAKDAEKFSPDLYSRYGSEISRDGSEINRYGSEIDKTLKVLFGYGLSNRYFQAEYGANAISYLVFSFGFLPSILLVFFLGTIDKSFAKIKTATLVAICTTYPYFNYAVFWVWLALYMYDDLYKREIKLRDFCRAEIA